MTPADWQRLKELLAGALALPAIERAEFLSRACAADAELRRRAESLLLESRSVDDFLESPALGGAAALLNEARMLAPAAALRSGQRLGRYQILSPLGAGGMGEVYRARDTKLRRDVAVKVLATDVAGDPDRLARFEREASAASALSDPHIVAVYDVGLEGQTPYIVSELIEGETLRAMLAGGPLPLAKALSLAEQIATGLAAAHDGGILHRDLKPENILVSNSGLAKIADFGLAKEIEDSGLGSDDVSSARTPTPGTAAGVILGTIGYMSPEQVHGHVADTRSDIFAFGCVLYEMLTGDRAFSGASPVEKMAAILKDDPLPPSRANAEVPPDLDRVVSRCLEKNPHQRFQSARDLAFAIRTVNVDPPPARPPRRRGRARIGTLAILPFANGADADLDYLSDGITEGLIGFLSQAPKLAVIARATSFRYKGKEGADPRQVGRDLNVDAVLTGVVKRRGEALSIEAELVDTAQGFRVWGDAYVRPALDILSVQEDIAREIWTRLLGAIPSGQRQRFARRYETNREAHALYLKGLHESNRGSIPGFLKSIDLFEAAVALDPGYALAYAGLADSTLYLGQDRFGAMPPREAFSRSEAYGRKAVEMDDELAEAHTAFGHARFFRWDFSGAEHEFQRALRLQPGSARTRHFYGMELMMLSRFEESADQLRRALSLDPLSPFLNADLGWSLYCARRFEAAIHQLRTTLSLEPRFTPGTAWLAIAMTAMGDNAGAIALAEGEMRRVGRLPLLVGIVGRAQALSGRAEEARKLLLELEHRASGGEYVTTVSILMIRIALGDRARAFEVLERAFEAGASYLVALNVYDTFDPIREDPRFTDLVARVGLPAIAAAPR